MDVLDPRSADELTEPAAPPEPPSPPRRRTRLLAVVPLVVLVALVATVLVLWSRLTGYDTADNARAAAMQAARQEAVNLVTIDYRTADRDLERVIAGATGVLRTDLQQQLHQLAPGLQAQQTVSTGTVLGAGVVTLHGNTATVAVALDRTVTARTGAGAKTRSTVQHYRMLVALVRVNGRWLADNVSFVGEPL